MAGKRSFIVISGIHWADERRGTMVIAFMCIAALPVPLFLYNFGPRLRAKDAKRLSEVEDASSDGSFRISDPNL